MRRLLVVLVGLVLLASACSGSSDVAAGPQGTNTVESSERAALKLIADLGSDAAATDALIIAMERGYSGPQILAAANATSLRADGTIEGEEPQGSPLGLVLYDGADAGEGASTGRGDADEERVLAFRQPERTPIELMRANAVTEYNVGESAAGGILAWLERGFTPEDVVEMLIFGVDGVDDYPVDPQGPVLCLRVVDELYCPGGERYPANQPETAADTPAPAETEESEAEPAAPMQLEWRGDLVAEPGVYEDPVGGTIILTRTPGTDEFQLVVTTANRTVGTFTTDGFNSVECTIVREDSFEGFGTFLPGAQRIEFEGEMTRGGRYVAGPCDSVLETTVGPFRGVQVQITDTGISYTTYGFNFEMAGPPPVPVGG